MEDTHFRILSKSKKILLIEDNITIRNMLVDSLKGYFFIKVADNGKEGLDLFFKESFDIVITDMMMPVMNGFQVCQEIRKINLEQPIVVISAYDDFDNLVKLVDLGIQSFILKPFTCGGLYEKLTIVLKGIYYKKVAERQKFRNYAKAKKQKTNQEYTPTIYPPTYSKQPSTKKEEWGLYMHEEEDIIFLCNELENNVNEMVFEKITYNNVSNLIDLFRKLASLLSLVDNFASVSKAFLVIASIYEKNISKINDPSRQDAFKLIEFIWNDVEKYMYDMFIYKNINNMNYFIDSLNSNIHNIETAIESKKQETGDVFFF